MRRGRGRAGRVRLKREVTVAVDAAAVVRVARVRRPRAMPRRPVRPVGPVGVAGGRPAVRRNPVHRGQAAVARRAARDAVGSVHGDQGRRDRLYSGERVPEMQTMRRVSVTSSSYVIHTIEPPTNQTKTVTAPLVLKGATAKMWC